MQDYADYEVILSDGGSTDATVEIFRSFAVPATKIVSKADRGVPHALNRGFSLASGEVFCWLNSDDVYISKQALRLTAETFLDKQCHIAFGHCVTMNDAGLIAKRLYAYAPFGRSERKSTNIFTGSLFFSRRAWLDFGGFSEKYHYAFEYELTKYLLDHNRPALINEFLAAFRVMDSGLSSRFNNLMSKECDEIYSDRELSPPFTRMVERIAAQTLQGTLWPALKEKLITNKRAPLHWREISIP